MPKKKNTSAKKRKKTPRKKANYLEMDASDENAIDYLKHLDFILLKPVYEKFESINIDYEHAFIILNNKNEIVYRAGQNGGSGFLFFTSAEMFVYDNFDEPIMRFTKVAGWTTVEMFAYCPPGHKIGSILDTSHFSRSLKIFDRHKSLIMLIESAGCCDIGEFRVLNPRRQIVGKIAQKWDEVFMDFWIQERDSYGVSFPEDLDYRVKILLIGACFLVDYLERARQAARR